MNAVLAAFQIQRPSAGIDRHIMPDSIRDIDGIVRRDGRIFRKNILPVFRRDTGIFVRGVIGQDTRQRRGKFRRRLIRLYGADAEKAGRHGHRKPRIPTLF